MPEFVKLVNEGDKEWKFEQSNRRRSLQPGEDAIVPWHLAAAIFGSPGVQNVGNNKYRDDLLKKKLLLNGFRSGFESDEAWEARRPKISVTDLDNNERIYMLLEDPLGEKTVNIPVPADKTDAEALQRQISTLQSEMQRLLSRLNAPQDAATGDTDSVTPSTDGPTFEDIPDDSSDDGPLIPTADTAATEDTPQAVAVDPVDPQPKRRSRRAK